MYADGSTETIHETPGIWEKNQKRATVVIPVKKAVRSLELTGGIWMDADRSNNQWTAK